MDRFQINTIKSFRNVKKDILDLKEQVTKLILKQEELMDILKKPSNNKIKSSNKRR